MLEEVIYLEGCHKENALVRFVDRDDVHRQVEVQRGTVAVECTYCTPLADDFTREKLWVRPSPICEAAMGKDAFEATLREHAPQFSIFRLRVVFRDCRGERVCRTLNVGHELLYAPADELARLVAEQLADFIVQLQDFPFGVGDYYRDHQTAAYEVD
eukprot:752347-Prorocentrum_minimum.AAC.3